MNRMKKKIEKSINIKLGELIAYMIFIEEIKFNME